MSSESFIEFTDQQLMKLFANVTEHSYKYAGAGSFYSQLPTNLSKIDRFRYRILSPHSEFSGLTFITRPRLNLGSSNLRQNRILSTIDTRDIQSIAFMIRALLDTKFCRQPENLELINRSPLLDYRNPFLTPLMNGLTDISGFPDYVIETYTTEGGFFNEDQTFAIGSDDLNHTFDLSLSFNDMQGGILMALLQIWLIYIKGVTRGELVAYIDDIEQQRLCYTSSIYRFLLDPSKRYITKWAKATGCFPKSLPIGACFNASHGEHFVTSSMGFSVPFTANKCEYNDPAILKDFNRLVQRYCPGIEQNNQMLIAPVTSNFNFVGIPYILDTKYGLQMVFKYDPGENDDDLNDTIAEVSAAIEAKRLEEIQAQQGAQTQSTQQTTPITTINQDGVTFV